MRKKLAFFFIGFVSSMTAFSQTPGYMGKRWVAYGNVQTFFNLTNPNQWNQRPGINLKYRAGLDFILSQKYSLAAEYEYVQTGATYKPEKVSSVSSKSDDSYDVTVRAMTVGLNFSWYETDKGSMAPYGYYQHAGLRYLLCAVTNEFGTMNRLSHSFALENYQFAVMTYGMGRRWIFFDRLTFQAGFELGYIFGAHPLGMVSPSDSYKSYLSDDINYGRTINRMSALYFVNFNIGLGFILF